LHDAARATVLELASRPLEHARVGEDVDRGEGERLRRHERGIERLGRDDMVAERDRVTGDRLLRDRDVRMDRRYDLHDVPHVRRADALFVTRLEDLLTERLHVVRPALRDRRGEDHVLVARVLVDRERELRAGGLRGALGARDRPEVGWIIIAVSTPSNPPARRSATFPPPPSSAGVPIAASVPGSESRTDWTPTAAAVPIMAMRLCPQPWPSSGSASYSARIAT